jgi:hypothetical protein
MKKSILMLLLTSMVVFGNYLKTEAITSGQGTLTWSFNESFQPTFIPWENPNVGRLNFQNVDTEEWTYPEGPEWDSQGNMFLNYMPYKYDNNYCTVSAEDKPPFSNFFKFEVVSPDQGIIEASTWGNPGNIGVFKFPNSVSFPAISYSYEFEGFTDSVSLGLFSLQFYHQMYVAYWDGTNEHYFYSNYCNPNNPQAYCYDFPLFRLGEKGTIQKSGTVSIGPFTLDSDVYNGAGWWEIRYGFCGSGIDLSGEMPTEPSIEKTIDFFDQAVEDGTLEGSGGGRRGRVKLLRMESYLTIASYFIERDRINFACFELRRAFLGCDGERAELVEGEGAEDLSQMIYDLAVSIDCRWAAD